MSEDKTSLLDAVQSLQDAAGALLALVRADNGGNGGAAVAIPYTIERAAELLERSPSTVRFWCQSGRLPAFKLARREWRVEPAGLKAFLAAERERHAAEQAAERDPPVSARTERKLRRL